MQKTRAGQAMIEYVITVAVVISFMSVMALFLYSYKQNSGRILELTASEYP